MQLVSPTLESTLEQQISLEIYSRVVAEWELNGYYETEVTGSISTDEELFPMADLALPRRPPRAGVPRLIVGQGRITSDSTWPKYRISGPESNYKYYHSEYTTNSSRVFTTPVSINMRYAESVPCNKFVAGFETSFSKPATVEVFVTYDSVDWISTGFHNVDADGLITMWLQSNGSWGEISTLYEENYAQVRGWRIEVEEMDKAGVGVSIIQISPRLSMDLTSRVIDVSLDRQREQYDLTNPIGTAAAATVDIQFANDDRFFDRENAESPINNLIDRNVKFDVSDVTVRSDGNSEAVAQGSFFADDWSPNSDGTVGVNGTDRSKFMQEAIVENSFYWNKTSEHVVQDILDRFGHPSYDVRYTSEDANRRVPFIFFKDNETVWEALQSLALAEQASFYFDEQDIFVWESRDYVWQNTTVDWSLRNETIDGDLPNIIDWQPSFEIAANKVNIKYTALAPATNAGQIVNNVVWEQSETRVLNASVLAEDMTTSSIYVRILREDFDFWPMEGIINIDGEYMRYKKSTETEGRLNLTERGLFDSTIKAHNRNPATNNWFFRTVRRVNASTTQNVNGNSSYGQHKLRNSYVELSTPGPPRHWLDTAHYFWGTPSNQYAYYGTELVFPMSETPEGEPYYAGVGAAGLTVNNDGSGDGYYFEIMTSQYAVSESPRKAEVRVWRRNGAGRTWMGGGDDSSKDLFPKSGRQFEILPGERYRIEVLYRRLHSVNHFSLFINGMSVLSFSDEKPGTKRTAGYWGVFCRSHTHARFDAVWAVESPVTDDDVATIYPTVRDRISGGYNSGMLESLWTKMNQKNADVIFEDFGPIVHGGYEFEVDYEIAPNTSTDLFVSNDQDTFVVFHERDPFKSKFAIMSKAREDAVLVGSDPSRDNEQMSLFVYGRPIVEQDERSATREDKLSRRRRGLEELELSSPWIQTRPRAERIADWVITRWGQSNDIVTAETILIPHLQVGDLLDVTAPSDNLYPETHQYNVIAISKSVGSSHNMSLTLRRRR